MLFHVDQKSKENHKVQIIKYQEEQRFKAGLQEHHCGVNKDIYPASDLQLERQRANPRISTGGAAAPLPPPSSVLTDGR